MKLKYIEINGQGVLVDESAEIGGDNCWTTKGLFLKTIKNGGIFRNFPNEEYSETYWEFEDVHKIICAEKELNINVPILPNWRKWEKFQLADKHTSKLLLTSEGRTQRWWGLLEGLDMNKAKYTEEDLKKALLIQQVEMLKSPKEGKLSLSQLMEKIIQSLEKVPKYIVLESECIVIGHTGTQNIFGETLKLTTNSERKQEVIIKEINY